MNNRLSRINSEIQKELSSLVSFKLKDPRLNNTFVSILEVDTTKDLSYSKVLISVFPDENRENALNAIKSSIPFLRREIAHNLKLIIVPEFIFTLDKGYAHEEKINKILKEIKNDKKD